MNIRRICILFLFLILTGGIIFNSAFFLHIHRTLGGVVVHAHPFDKQSESNNPLSQHKHTKIYLQVVSYADYYINNQFNLLLIYKPSLENIIKINYERFSGKGIYYKLPNRGPPFRLV